MIFWIIIGLGILMGVGWAIDEGGDDKNIHMVGYGLVGVFWATILAFTVCAILASSIDDYQVHPHSNRQNLVAAIDTTAKSSHVEGSYLLIAGGVSGSTTEDVNYAWYSQDTSGAINPHTGVRADDNTHIKLFYTKPGEQPYVVRRTYTVTNSTRWWISPIDLTSNTYYNYTDDETWELHVPEDSIVRKFEFNLGQ